jgi:hypothetical protein
MQEQHRGLIEDLECGRLESDPNARPRTELSSPDSYSLVAEYLEDRIDNSVLTEPIHRTLERQVDAVRRKQKKTF